MSMVVRSSWTIRSEPSVWMDSAVPSSGSPWASSIRTRRPIVEKLVGASKTSAQWYERFPEHMQLAPIDLAMSYICRSGRIDDERLRAMAPRFMQLYENRRRNGG